MDSWSSGPGLYDSEGHVRIAPQITKGKEVIVAYGGSRERMWLTVASSSHFFTFTLKVQFFTHASPPFHSDQEDEMAKALLSFGPLVVIVDAVSWQDYLGGIIQHHCSSGEANHAVLITGFDRTGKSQCTESLPKMELWARATQRILRCPAVPQKPRLSSWQIHQVLSISLPHPMCVWGRCFAGHSILWVAYTRPALGHWATPQSINETLNSCEIHASSAIFRVTIGMR